MVASRVLNCWAQGQWRGPRRVGVPERLTSGPGMLIKRSRVVRATLSWAIYGAAKEWLRTPGRCSSEDVVDQVMALVQPVFASAFAASGPGTVVA